MWACHSNILRNICGKVYKVEHLGDTEPCLRRSEKNFPVISKLRQKREQLSPRGSRWTGASSKRTSTCRSLEVRGKTGCWKNWRRRLGGRRTVKRTRENRQALTTISNRLYHKLSLHSSSSNIASTPQTHAACLVSWTIGNQLLSGWTCGMADPKGKPEGLWVLNSTNLKNQWNMENTGRSEFTRKYQTEERGLGQEP